MRAELWEMPGGAGLLFVGLNEDKKAEMRSAGMRVVAEAEVEDEAAAVEWFVGEAEERSGDKVKVKAVSQDELRRRAEQWVKENPDDDCLQ